MRLNNIVLHWLVLSRSLLLLWPVQFSTKESLYFEYSFVFVDTELLKKSIVVFFKEAFQYLEFYHVVIILGVSGL